MYSSAWFETFAETVPAASTAAEVEAVVRLAPPAEYGRLLDLGCGIGRTAAHLAGRGYRVTGVDVSSDALRTAARAAPGATFVALDQRHVGRLRWRFDVVVVLWNSFGFGTRAGDHATLRGIRRVLRPGGRILMDLYHPGWLASRARRGEIDGRGATIDRWLADRRCMHEIRYTSGQVDHISFNVYTPDEIVTALAGAGFAVGRPMARWTPAMSPSADLARFQVVGTARTAGIRARSSGL